MRRRPTRLNVTRLEERTTPATVFTVTGTGDDDTRDGVLTLREALLAQRGDVTLSAAELAHVADAPGLSRDTIGFAPPLGGQTFTLAANDSSAANRYGRTGFVVTTAVAIDGATGTGQGVTISGGGSERLFAVTSAGDLSLANLTLSGGLAKGGAGGDGGGGAAGLGGAVFVDQGVLTITGSTLTGNQAVGGAGSPMHSVALGTLGAGTGGGGLLGPAAGGTGGGPNGGTPGITGTTTAGVAGGAGGFGGGGGAGSGSLNAGLGAGGAGGFGGGGGSAASQGGARGYVRYGTGGAGGFGGGGGSGNGRAGLFGGAGASGSQQMSVTTYVSGGGAGLGGAVFNNAGSVAVRDTTFTANTATGGPAGASYGGGGQGAGGAVFSRNGSLTIIAGTLSANTAASGGTDVYVVADSAMGGGGDTANTGAAAVTITASILGQASAAVPDLTTSTNGTGAAVTAAGTNDLIRSTAANGVGNLSAADPQLGPLQDNGGPTKTMAPLPGSLAIDGGGATAPGGLSLDQRGPGFARLVNGAADLGAVEAQTPATVPTVGPGALPNGLAGARYATILTVSGPAGPYTFAVTGGSPPTGFTLTATGTTGRAATLAGTPAAGTYTFTVRVTNPTGDTASRDYTLSVLPLVVGPATLPAGIPGTYYAQTTTAAGGTGPYTFGVTVGSLPSGWTLSAAGVLSGTPSAVGTATFTVAATGADGSTGSRAYTLVIDVPVVVGPASISAASQGAAYTQVIAATGPAGPYTFAVTAGALPAGLVLSAAGVLSGTPTAAGSFPFTITATNLNRSAGSKAYTLTVAGFTLGPTTLPDAQVGVGYAQTVTASGATAPYTFAVTTGSLPTGLTLTADGKLTGTPRTGANWFFTVTATSAAGFTAYQAYSLVVAPIALGPTSFPYGNQGTPYTQTITATGAPGPYTFAVTAGPLPAGLTLSADGVLAGTPTATGSYTFAVTATNPGGFTGARTYPLFIAAAVVGVGPPTLPPGQVGVVYDQTITSSGATAPYTFAVTSGSLPAGLTLSTAGSLAGTPTAGGTSSFTITATSADRITANRSYSLVIAPVAVGPASLPFGQVAASYAQTLTATGPAGPYTFAVTAGGLPAGLTLAPDGTLSGTPTAAGSYSFTVTATSAGEYSGTRAYTLVVYAFADTITVTSLADDGRPGTLRAALAQANLDPRAAAVTVVFAVDGVITLAGGELALTRTVAPVAIAAAGHMITIDAHQASRDFRVDPGVTATLSGLTITNGSATDGGGISNAATLTVLGSTITGGRAGFRGGAIYNTGMLTVDGSTISGNSAPTDGGGGIDNRAGTLTVIRSTFTGNAASYGGGIYAAADVDITASTFAGNTVSYYGGGIDVSVSATVTVRRSTFSGNAAVVYGGGINMQGHVVVTGSTFVGNSAGTGGGFSSDANDLTLTGSIVSGNVLSGSGGSGPDVGGSIFTDGGYNLFGTALRGSTSGPGDLYTDSPGVAPLADNGGPTRTLALLAGSPAVDAGDPADTSADQRGTAVQNGRRDIGAFESSVGHVLTAGALTPPRPTEGVPVAAAALFHFTDTNADAVAGDFAATVAWGDGVVETTGGSVRVVANGGGGFDVRGGHTYAAAAAGLTFAVNVVAGGSSAGASATIAVADATPPDTTLTAHPPAVSAAAAASFALAGTDNFTAAGSLVFAYRLDGGSWLPAPGGPVGFTGLADGAHTFEVRATDAAGNTDPTPATFTWAIDTTAPDTALSGGPALVTSATGAAFTLSATDPSPSAGGASFQYRLDGGSWQPAAGTSVTLSGLADGAHTFEVRAVDAAGNLDPTPATYAWVIDTAAPETTLSGGPTLVTTGTGAGFQLAATDPAPSSGITEFEYRLDGGNWQPAAAGPVGLSGLADASHTFEARATDAAGNVDPTPASFTWVIDTTAPDTAITTRPAAVAGSGTAAFGFTGSDPAPSAGVGSFQYRLDGGGWQPAGGAAVTLSGLADGAHTFEARAADAAGNADPTPAAYAWAIDTAAPDTAVPTGPAAVSPSRVAGFTLASTDPSPSAGVAGYEYRLDGGGWQTTAATSVAFSGLADGAHTFQARAVDAAGNADPSPASYAWTVDATAPNTTITTRPAPVAAAPAVAFGFTGFDLPSAAGLTFEYRLDGGSWQPTAAGSVGLTGLADGAHTFEARAVDAAGNADPTPATYTWAIDTAAPDTALSGGPPAVTTATGAAFTLSAADPAPSSGVSRIEYRLDGGSWQPAAGGTVALPGLASGGHTFAARAVDAAGNTDASPASSSWVIEDQPPPPVVVPPAPVVPTPISTGADPTAGGGSATPVTPAARGIGRFAVGADAGGSSTVTVHNPDGTVAYTVTPFPGFAGGVRTAVADFTGDGTPDLAVGTGPGTTAEVKVIDGRTHEPVADLFPFGAFTGGVFVAGGDVTGDGTADLVATPDRGGGPRVSVFRGGDFAPAANFFGIDDPGFRGGARAAAGDITGDGVADLVVSAGFGGGPRLSVYDGAALAAGRLVHPVGDFFAFPDQLRNGTYLAVGDVDADGSADLVIGAGPGGGPQVLVVSGKALLDRGAAAAVDHPETNFYAGDPDNRGGVRVAVKDLDGDGHADVVTGAGQGGGSGVTTYSGATLAGGTAVRGMDFDDLAGFGGGVFVG